MNPPLLKGGQGRSDDSMHDSANALCVIAAAALALVLWGLIAWALA